MRVAAQRAGDTPGPGSNRGSGLPPSLPPAGDSNGSSMEEFTPFVAGTSLIVKQSLTMTTETVTRIGQRTMSPKPIRSETSTKILQRLEVVKADRSGLTIRTPGPYVEGEVAPGGDAARTFSIDPDGSVRDTAGLDPDTKEIVMASSDLLMRMFGSSEVARTTGSSFSVPAKRALLLLAPGFDHLDGTWVFKRRPQQAGTVARFDIIVSNCSGAFTNWTGSAAITPSDGAVTIQLGAAATQPIVPDKAYAQEIQQTVEGLSKEHAQAEIQQAVTYERRVERPGATKGADQGQK